MGGRTGYGEDGGATTGGGTLKEGLTQMTLGQVMAIDRALAGIGASVGANYREANRAESRKDFIHKIAIVGKEAAETQYWLELCNEADIDNARQRRWLLKESGELLAIFTASGRTAKSGR